MARYRHFLNSGKGDDFTFATTTCLDFANLFERPEIRTQVVALIRESCAIKSVKLHAYVVISNHIHLLMHLGTETSVSSYMNSFKAYTAREIGQKLTKAERQTLSDQAGLGRRTFW